MNSIRIIKVGCVFPVAVVSVLPHAEFGPNDYQEDAPHFKLLSGYLSAHLTQLPSDKTPKQDSNSFQQIVRSLFSS